MSREEFQAEGVDLSSPQGSALGAIRIPDGERIVVHMTHLNHLDLTWYWQLPDTIEMCLETIRWHVDLLERHPDARYSHTQAFILSVVERIDPPLFERFARLVGEGRVELDSGQWVEPDHNLPSGESLARQFLYGQSYLLDRFGVTARTLVNSDSFGHSRNLPQIARLAGIEHMIFKRPRQKYVDLPETPFRWVGLDGTEITALRFINKGAGLPSLSQGYTFPPGTNELQIKVDRNLAAGVHHLFGSHCNADSGGVTPYVSPVEGETYSLRYDTPTGFFRAALDENPALPIVDRPLNHIYQGCYTSHIEEKENCRRAEQELRALELLWTLARVRGLERSVPSLDELWRRLCFLQFHDIVTGTGSPESHRESGASYIELFREAKILRRRAETALDRSIACRGALRTFTVANPRPYEAGGVVAVDAELPIVRGTGGPLIPSEGVLEGDDGSRTPYQVIDSRTFQRYVRGTMLFPASSVPALGLKSYRLLPEEPPVSGVRASGDTLENDLLRVEVGGRGIIRSIVTKADGRERLRAVDAPVRIELWPETEFPGDYGTPMQAWMLGITEDRRDAEPTGNVSIVENGPVRATIRVEHRWGGSSFVTDVSLCAGDDGVRIGMSLDWQEKETLCRLCVEPEVHGGISRTFGAHFGYERASGDELEIPAQGWADISGDGGGLALLDRDRPGHTFRDGCLRASVVRCATGDYDPRTDGGPIHAEFRLIPHAGRAVDAEIARRSDEFSHPLHAWQSEPSAATEIGWGATASIEGGAVELTACKPAQDGDGYAFRLYESAGEQATAVLTLGEPLRGASVEEADLLEREGRTLVQSDGRVRLTFRPFEIKTLIVTPAPR